MSEFKVGDGVRVVYDFGLVGMSAGDIGTVCDNEAGLCYVYFKSDDLKIALSKDQLELVEPKSDQDQVKALLKGANIGATMIGDALAKSQEAKLTTRYGERYKEYIDVATKSYNCRCTLTPTIKEYPNPPHKHKDVIIAWANGADIERYLGGRWNGDYDPSWSDRSEYRTKPTKTPLQLKIEKLEAKLAKLKGQL